MAPNALAHLEYHSWVYMRKCPQCDSQNYTRTRASVIEKVFRDGKLYGEGVKRISDMGNFTCDDCGFFEGATEVREGRKKDV